MAVAIGHNRKIWTLDDYPRTQRRLKACMKQVVGRPFAELERKAEESAFVEDILRYAKTKQSSIRSIKHFNDAAILLARKLRHLIGAQVSSYLEYFVGRLFDTNVKLTFNFFNNSCQEFCDAIIPHKDFSQIFGPINGKLSYLISFVVPLESYHRTTVYSRYDVPNGLTEEYLSSFRQGRHDDADIFDTLSEYWHYWGAFPNYLYPNQDLFPWDCTEAYKSDAPVCNSCSLGKHVWAFPFDSWSIIQLHLQKDRNWYPASNHATQPTDELWFKNRMKILMARNLLLKGTIAMSLTSAIRITSQQAVPTGGAPVLDRLKLGGIHRAQPFSHHFEKNKSVYYLLAPWVTCPVVQRVTYYEAYRSMRQKAKDVVNDDFDEHMMGADSVVQAIGGGMDGLLLWDFSSMDIGSHTIQAADPGTITDSFSSIGDAVGDMFNM